MELDILYHLIVFLAYLIYPENMVLYNTVVDEMQDQGHYQIEQKQWYLTFQELFNSSVRVDQFHFLQDIQSWNNVGQAIFHHNLSQIPRSNCG